MNILNYLIYDVFNLTFNCEAYYYGYYGHGKIGHGKKYLIILLKMSILSRLEEKILFYV